MARVGDLLAKLPLPGASGLAADRPPMGRFVLMGLPRSGTTYLMSLLHSHPEIFCTGEQFNPHAVVGLNGEDRSPEAVLTRDGDPVAHMHRVFAEAAASGAAQGGFKFMLGHNIEVFKALAEDPELRIIHVWRENRLAQVASMLKAVQSKRWTQTRKDAAYVAQTIEGRPRQISQRWHEWATIDHLTAQLLQNLPQQVLTLEYTTLFAPDVPARLCDFLGVAPSPRMKSRLLKQGVNRVVDRFTTPGPIVHYFTQIGREDWLGEEI